MKRGSAPNFLPRYWGVVAVVPGRPEYGTIGSVVTDPPPGFPRVLPHLIYEDVDAAVVWLTEVFGFRERMAAHHEEADGTTGRAQIEIAESLITVGRPSLHGESPRRGVSSMLYVFVDDIRLHYDHVTSRGARIVTEPQTHAGDTRYQVADPEGTNGPSPSVSAIHDQACPIRVSGQRSSGGLLPPTRRPLSQGRRAPPATPRLSQDRREWRYNGRNLGKGALPGGCRRACGAVG